MRKISNSILILGILVQHVQAQINEDTTGHRKKIHFSVVPGLSFVKANDHKEIKNASVNLFFGYSKGIDGFEVAGLGNITHGDVRYFQGAGLLNVVHGNQTGFQGAGLVNLVSKKSNGFQGAGLINVSGDSLIGMQGSGLINLCGTNVKGIQAAGLINVAGKNTTGIQASGLINVSPSIKGLQAAGLINVAKHCEGNQISGLINVTKSIKGSQIGVLNFADSCTGVPIGFLSFVRNGYHKIELSADEIFYTNFAFRTGAKQFHNIFSVGVTPQKKQHQLWTFGYGLGSSFKLAEKLLLDIDLSANQINKINVPLAISEDSLTLNQRNQRLNLNNKVYVGVEWQFAKKISLAAGPVFNLMLTDDRNADYANVFSQLQPNYWYSKKVDDHLHMNVWVGARVAIRFL